MNDKEFNEKYEQLKKSNFKQQKLPGWRPLPTLSCITIIYLSFAVFFIIFGIIILVFTSQVKEIKVRYDNFGLCVNHTECEVSIHVTEKMKKPIMIYYQLNGFSQNHRVYMESKNDKQLKGEEVSKDDLEKSGECEYALFNHKKTSISGNELDTTDVSIPCGLLAKSYFRDIYSDWRVGGKPIEPKFENIVYKADKEKYQNFENFENQWINMTDEHFINWMRPSPFSNPRKLWGIIEDEDIEQGSSVLFKVNINNYYSYKKYIILSTRNVFGGKNMFLGICYIIFGVICLISSITFIITFNSFHKKK